MQKFQMCAKISGGVGVLCRNYWKCHQGAVQNFQVVLGCCAKISGGVGGVCGGCGWCCVKCTNGARRCCVKFSGGERMLCKNFLELGGALQKFMGALRCCGKFSGCVSMLWKIFWG